ncbi:beta-galactosidase [Clostridia bacterium]|nr:beta-galactosidase [Clostridia bacterium]
MFRKKLLMDQSWKFHKGDVAYKPIRGHDYTYEASKAEHAKGAAARDFADFGWREVDLPHDYVVEGTPSEAENHDHGCLSRDNAWYRRHFKLDEEDRGRRSVLLFDGVVSTCTVWVNGILLGRNYTGGVSFEIDFTDVAVYGEDINTVSVYVDNSDFEGWYYEGGGINRHVWLVVTDKIHLGLWGVFVKTIQEADGVWKTEIETEAANSNYHESSISLVSEIIDAEGRQAGKAESALMLPPRENINTSQVITFSNPRLWSPEEPALYTLVSRIYANGEEIDAVETAFGYRTIEFHPEKGFFLNGKHTQIRGMSNHQDYGGLGVALPDSIHEYRIKLLKEMGVNAYRCAHHPHAPEIYDACDRLGMMVMDETRWFDSSPEGLAQVQMMIKRDRNHPSVIMWALFNEEPMMDREAGSRIMASMCDRARKTDPTRPSTAAYFFGLERPGCADDADILGINYHPEMYDKLHAQYPDMAMFGSEIGCGFTSRGVEAWKAVDTRPYMMGAFPWTGLKYRGESVWPQLFSRGGAIDHCGLPTSGYHMYKSYWSKSPYAVIWPHWDWKGREGEIIEVVVFTNGHEAELSLNGKSLGLKSVDHYEMVKWAVKYEPGVLKVATYKDHAAHAEFAIETADKPVGLVLVPKDSVFKADGEYAAVIDAFAVDAAGRRVYSANGLSVEFETNEAGRILAAWNPDRTDASLPSEPKSKLFEGVCQVIVRSTGIYAPLVVRASCAGLNGAEIRMETEGAEKRPAVNAEPNRYIPVWKLSSVETVRPDLERVISDDKSDSWAEVEVTRGTPMMFEALFPRAPMMDKPISEEPGFVVYHAKSIIPCPANVNQLKTPVLHFESFEGRPDIIVLSDSGKSDRLTYKEFNTGGLSFSLPEFEPGDKVNIWLILEGNNTFSAIMRPVRWKFA